MAQARLGVEGAKTLLVQDVLLMVGKEQDEGADGTVGVVLFTDELQKFAYKKDLAVEPAHCAHAQIVLAGNDGSLLDVTGDRRGVDAAHVFKRSLERGFEIEVGPCKDGKGACITAFDDDLSFAELNEKRLDFTDRHVDGCGENLSARFNA